MRRNSVRLGLALIAGVLSLLAWRQIGSIRAAEGDAPASMPPLKVLFLGDNGHHQPHARFDQLQPVLAKRNITLDYTDKLDDVNPTKLGSYEALLIYANIDSITPEAEQAILDYVSAGHGLVPLHCASYCFRNSPQYIALVGAQFKSHNTGVVHTNIVAPEHPIMAGFGGFESWDETYVHTKHNDQDRTVLETRPTGEGKAEEPWTWVRTQGKGRVFYTAWGHDQRTWAQPGFQNLVERGIRWAAGGDPSVVPPYSDRPAMTAPRTDVKAFEYVDAEVPIYTAGKKWGTLGEPQRQMQKPLEPEESLKHYVVPEGFKLKLFAAEPDIGKPIAMAWDERGRLWIAETVDYPNQKQPEGEGHDRIRICEDTNGDGRADKFTVFAEGLSIPTSLAFSNGGVLVMQPPQLLFLKDTDGDDRADEKRVLIDGFSARDTHATASNLNYGPDNWFYGIIGYSTFTGEVGGEKISFRQGFWRFKPDCSKIEFLRSTSNNSWGVGFTEDGLLFGSTANNNPSVFGAIPNRYYERVRGWTAGVLPMIAESSKFYPLTDKVRQVDWHGRFTAAAGHAIYTARSYPLPFWNRAAFVTECTGHLISTFVLRPDGAGFKSRYDWNLAASDDEWAAPISAEVGPDGQVWFIDWYNYIVQHNPTPSGYKTGRGNAYESELRDKQHGRIYRLVYTGAKPEQSMSLAGASPATLVSTLKNSNLLWRRHAQRLLVERGRLDVLPKLIELVKDQSQDEIGLNVGALHAIWTINGLCEGASWTPEAVAAVTGALRQPCAAVRRSALLCLPKSAESVAAILTARSLRDPEPQVRLAAMIALADQPATEDAAAAIAASLADKTNLSDSILSDGLTCAAASNAQSILASLTANAPANLPASAAKIIQRVAEHYARGQPNQISPLFVSLSGASEEVITPIVAGLSQGWPKDKPAQLDDVASAALEKLVARVAPQQRAAIVVLATRLGSSSLDKIAAPVIESLWVEVRDEKIPADRRIEAADQLIDLRRKDVSIAAGLLELISPRTSLEFSDRMFEVVGHSEAPEAGQAIVEHLAALTPTQRATGIKLLLAHSDWVKSLLGGLEHGQLTLADLSLDQKQSLAAHPDVEIAKAAAELLKRGGGLPNADRQNVVDELASLAQKTGDAAAGKLVFTKQCSKCHSHSGEGGKTGPDLTGMAVHPKHELLIQILDPSRSVEGTYRAYTITTQDGLVLTGILASETKTSVDLLDAEGKSHTLQRDNIDQMVASTKSLMPDGFEKQMSPDDLANLLEFLTQHGRFLPIPLEKFATVVSTRGMLTEPNLVEDRLEFDDWSQKTTEGVPFRLVDPKGDSVPNAIMLYSPKGKIPPTMPREVALPCNVPAKAIHILGGVAGWGYPDGEKGSVSMIVRLHFADGQTEDHPLHNGQEIADSARNVEVPGSKEAFILKGRQLRYLAVEPVRHDPITSIDLVKGPDSTAPIVMAVTVETPSTQAQGE